MVRKMGVNDIIKQNERVKSSLWKIYENVFFCIYIK